METDLPVRGSLLTADRSLLLGDHGGDSDTHFVTTHIHWWTQHVVTF
jgi:hypothetical protein